MMDPMDPMDEIKSLDIPEDSISPRFGDSIEVLTPDANAPRR